MKIVQLFTKCVARKIVQKFFILYQFVLVFVLIILLIINYNIFSNTFNLFYSLYVVFNIWCSVVETDSAMISPKWSRDLTTIFVVLFMQFTLAIWCVSLSMYLLINTGDSKLNSDASDGLMSHDSACLRVSIIFIADFVNQFLWALYLSFRFIRQLFPRGEKGVIYQNKVEEITILVEDGEVELPEDIIEGVV